MILGRKTKRPTPELKDLAYHHDEDPTPEEDYNRGTAKAVRKELGIPEEAPESEVPYSHFGELLEGYKNLKAENKRLTDVNKSWSVYRMKYETAQATIERVREIANIQDPRWGTSAKVLAEKIKDALKDKE